MEERCVEGVYLVTVCGGGAVKRGGWVEKADAGDSKWRKEEVS